MRHFLNNFVFKISKVKKIFLTIVYVTAATTLVCAFQNCADEYNSATYGGTDSSSQGDYTDLGGDQDVSPDPNTAPGPTPTGLPASQTYAADGAFRISKNEYAETNELKIAQQSDANLVITRKSDGAVLWTSRDVSDASLCAIGCFTQFQNDGNLVSYSIKNNSAALKATVPHCNNTDPYCSVGYWSAQVTGTGFRLVFSNVSPYLRILDPASVVKWRDNLPPVVVTAPTDYSGSCAYSCFALPINQERFSAGTTVFNVVTFTVVAKSSDRLTYQWSRVSDTGVVTPVTGATLSAYSFGMTSLNQLGTYRVTITNRFGSTYSDVRLIEWTY